jgi:hypothetical protein
MTIPATNSDPRYSKAIHKGSRTKYDHWRCWKMLALLMVLAALISALASLASIQQHVRIRVFPSASVPFHDA